MNYKVIDTCYWCGEPTIVELGDGKRRYEGDVTGMGITSFKLGHLHCIDDATSHSRAEWRSLTAERGRLAAELAVSRKWSRRWKALAQKGRSYAHLSATIAAKYIRLFSETKDDLAAMTAKRDRLAATLVLAEEQLIIKRQNAERDRAALCGQIGALTAERDRLAAEREHLQAAWLECEGIAALGRLEPTVAGVTQLIAERDAFGSLLHAIKAELPELLARMNGLLWDNAANEEEIDALVATWERRLKEVEVL